MFEKIAQQCCNYCDRECYGAFFKFVNGELVHWIDGKREKKPCLVTGKHYCKWFNEVVLPGTTMVAHSTKDKVLLQQIGRWEKFVAEQAGNEEKEEDTATKGKYRKICKRCAKQFWADSPKKRYCGSCRVTSKAICDREASRRYRDKKRHDRQAKGSVTR